MGNLCGKQSSSNFTSPGRVLGGGGGSSAPAATTARIPSAAKTTTKPASSSSSSTPHHGKTLGTQPQAGADARAAAAKAAQERANSQTPKGKIGFELGKERGKTQRQHLADASAANRQQDTLVWD